MKLSSISTYLVAACLLASGISSAQVNERNNASTKNKKVSMETTEGNKEIIRKLYEESLNKRNLELLHDLIAVDYVGVRGAKGPASFEDPIAALIKAFPDIHWKLEALIGEGDQVVVEWKWQGTHTNQFTGFPATNKLISNDGMAIFELKNGKIIASHVQTDRLGFLQALEVLPQDIASLPKKKIFADKVSLIDKFFVPAAAKKEFYERVSINRNLIKTLPGFIEDAAYEYTDAEGNLIYVTVAQWQNKEVFNNAKEVVQTEYKKQGFDMNEMLKRTNIVIDRGVYTELAEK
jgi:steroid delta-isomerase-like uncharacterized protein